MIDPWFHEPPSDAEQRQEVTAAAPVPGQRLLSPCPFCGGKRLRVQKAPRFGPETKPDEPEGSNYYVFCAGCGAQGGHAKGPGFPGEGTEEERLEMGPAGARRWWNMRWPRTRAYRCTDCNRTFQVPHEAPHHMDPQRPDGTFAAFLACPWCDGHCDELEGGTT